MNHFESQNESTFGKSLTMAPKAKVQPIGGGNSTVVGGATLEAHNYMMFPMQGNHHSRMSLNEHLNTGEVPSDTMSNNDIQS